MQASLREPDASGVPQEQFQAIASGVAKQIEPTGAGRLLKAVLYAGGESVYPQAHVDRFEDQLDRQAGGLRRLVSRCVTRCVGQGVG